MDAFFLVFSAFSASLLIFRFPLAGALGFASSRSDGFLATGVSEDTDKCKYDEDDEDDEEYEDEDE